MEEALNAASRECNVDALYPEILDYVNKALMAARVGNVDALYCLIKADPEILSRINNVGYADTPLHEAAGSGQTKFAIELMALMPSFAKKLNPQGLSPLHLAVMSEADTEERARKNKTAMALIKLDAELVRVKGRAMMTPLHYAVRANNLEPLAEFLCACPKSINDLTNEHQSAVHIAVQERMPKALDVLLGWLSRRSKEEEGVLRFKDSDGNTALHIAVKTEQFEVVKKLISKVNCNSMNSEGLTAWDIAVQQGNSDIKELLKNRGGRSGNSLPREEHLHDFLRKKQGPFEKPIGYLIYVDKQMSLEMRNFILVVAALIVTATFQGALQPPGGYWVGDGETSQKVSTFNRSNNSAKFGRHNFRKLHNTTRVFGEVVMSSSNFRAFMGGNTVAFVSAAVMILLVLPARSYAYSLHLSLLFLTYTYLTAVDIISEQSLLKTSVIIVAGLFIGGALTLRIYMHIAKSIFYDAWSLPRLYVLATTIFYRIPRNPAGNNLVQFVNRLMMRRKVSGLEPNN